MMRPVPQSIAALSRQLKACATVVGDQITLSRDDLRALMLGFAQTMILKRPKAAAALARAPDLNEDLARITKILAMPGIEGWASVNGFELRAAGPADVAECRIDFNELLGELGTLAASPHLSGELCVRYGGHESVLEW